MFGSLKYSLDLESCLYLRSRALAILFTRTLAFMIFVKTPFCSGDHGNGKLLNTDVAFTTGYAALP